MNLGAESNAKRSRTGLILADFVGRGDKLCHFGTKVMVPAGGTKARCRGRPKNQEHQIALMLLFDPAFESTYCNTVKAWQAAVVVTGALPAAPGLNRSTPSSLAQKLRTPDWLKVTGRSEEHTSELQSQSN